MASFIHHPAFQSLLLPALLCLVCLGALRLGLGAARGPWVSLGAPLGLVLALAAWPGLGWPASTQAHKLPWVVLASALAVLLALASSTANARHRPLRPWLAAALVWLVASAWLLGLASPLHWPLAAAGGALALGVLAWSTEAPGAEPTAAAGSAGALAVVLLGLVGLAIGAGSLLLAQLGLMAAIASAVLGLWAWAWPRAGVRVGAAALMPLGSAALGLLCLNLATGRVPAGVPALLLLALTAPWWLARRAGAVPHWRWRPLVVALLAAIPVLAALGWQALRPGDAPGAGTAGDDPYYTPRW